MKMQCQRVECVHVSSDCASFAVIMVMVWQCSDAHPGHGLWCAMMGTGGHRAPRAAGSARRPQGEAAPDRKTTSQGLQSQCSNPLPAGRGPKQEHEKGWGVGCKDGGRSEQTGCKYVCIRYKTEYLYIAGES